MDKAMVTLDRVAEAARLVGYEGRLTGLEASIVACRYVGGRSLAWTAEAHGLSPERTRQIEMRVLAGLDEFAFDVLTGLAQEARGAEWAWHGSVLRARYLASA